MDYRVKCLEEMILVMIIGEVAALIAATGLDGRPSTYVALHYIYTALSWWVADRCEAIYTRLYTYNKRRKKRWKKTA